MRNCWALVAHVMCCRPACRVHTAGWVVGLHMLRPAAKLASACCVVSRHGWPATFLTQWTCSQNIHHLCTVAIALKVVDQVCALGYLHDFGQHGENTSALFVVRQIVGSVSATTFLSVLLLMWVVPVLPVFLRVGSRSVCLTSAQGWSLTRARLSRRELRIMLAMIAVYLTIGIMKAFCNDGDRLCGAYLVRQLRAWRVWFAWLTPFAALFRVPSAHRIRGSLVGYAGHHCRHELQHHGTLSSALCWLLAGLTAMSGEQHLRTSVHDGPWAPSLPAAYRHLRHFQ